MPILLAGNSEKLSSKLGTGVTYLGTAGAMLDFSPAGGLAPTVSSFSRIVFSPAARRRVAMVVDGRVVMLVMAGADDMKERR